MMTPKPMIRHLPKFLLAFAVASLIAPHFAFANSETHSEMQPKHDTAMNSMAETPARNDKTSFKETLDQRHESFPELAAMHGYYVDHDQAKKRGGVGAYVDRPSGKERERIDAYAAVLRFSNFHRNDDGALVIRLNNGVLFDTNSSELSGTAQSRLDKLAKLMEIEGIRQGSISGHTDDRGPASFNRTLADQRAASVRAYLKSIDSNFTLNSYGMGETAPVASNDNVFGRRLNRRAEIVIVDEPRVEDVIQAE